MFTRLFMDGRLQERNRPDSAARFAANTLSRLARPTGLGGLQQAASQSARCTRSSPGSNTSIAARQVVSAPPPRFAGRNLPG